MKTGLLIAAAALSLAAATSALADAGHGKGHNFDFGRPGKASAATRTVEVVMRDIAFEPESISIKAGETIRFVLKNEGELLHEFNIGTAAMHAEHQKEMAEMLDHGMITPTGMDHKMMQMDHGGGRAPMRHDDPNTALVEPGKTAELVWTFTRDTELEFACNIPGHYEAGMVGKFRFGK
ncbi:MAG: plastocyanin/azurin family copper-binding protein [Alphaproteobacteria bacterium]